MVNFLKYRFIYFLISATVIGVGVFSMFKWGYIYSIDFVGGTNLEYQVSKPVENGALTKVIKGNKLEIVNITSNSNMVRLRLKAINDIQETKLKQDLEKQLRIKITVLKSETVGPTLGRETIYKTVTAAIIGIIAILIYMSFAFKGFNFAIAAILAAIHDMLVIFGCYSLMSHFFGAQMDTLFVTAILTSLSLSVHDTIVVFDKIREYRTSEGGRNLEHFANKALTETMVRSVNNTMTIIFMLLALVLLGGTTITFFAATLLVGTITGTYSSPFIATPIVVWLETKSRK